jgi:cytidyltransferase-like protein
MFRTAFVSGTYEILHGGHVRFFRDARAQADRLVVCIASDRTIRAWKGREPAIPLAHRLEVMGALKMVDECCVGSGDGPAWLNFLPEFRARQPAVLVVTEDDAHYEEKAGLCAELGTRCVRLPKTLPVPEEPVSTTAIRRRSRAPERVPVRVDFAGGWLDVPHLARPDAFIVNCAVSPTVSLADWPYEKRAGVGGSGAFHALRGDDAVEAEVAAGSGWQDPAVIIETGLCVWRSGPRPVLEFKRSGDMLRGRMALLYTGKPHDTPSLVERRRDYDLIAEAGRGARRAVLEGSLSLLCEAVAMQYRAQVDEGMDEIHVPGASATKYCGSGWGGYALTVFESETRRNAFVVGTQGAMAIEPFDRWSPAAS